MRPLSRQQRGRIGRANLVRAALAVFSRKGFESTSVEEICLAAGYSKGGFYFHFRSKEDLLASILEGGDEVLDEGWLDALSTELWAQAGRNGAVRAQLVRRSDARYQRLLESALSNSNNQRGASKLSVLLLLDAGLRVQRRFLASPGDDAQRFVDSRIDALTRRSVDAREQSRRAAG